jgi:[FeFe] hydrogenase H-cluster maturation GTPase HydF
MQAAPKGLRLHIGIFGRRNVGKSSILNALTGQETAIVSPQAGTTTDPVEKPMELLPLGPVVFIDTAGIDDEGALGEQRMAKTMQVLQRTELALVVMEAGTKTVSDTVSFEGELLEKLRRLKVPGIVVCNKVDVRPPAEEHEALASENGFPFCAVSATKGTGIDELRRAIIRSAPEELMATPAVVSDLVGPGKVAVLVAPIDKEAPKGRLIVPQVQAIRDLLDGDSIAVVTKERELRRTLEMLKERPAIVVTDSQAFLKVAADTPQDVPMTSFSILFARLKGDLVEMVKGAMEIQNLRSGDKVMIAEACTHHPITDDIGTVKIPRWLNQFVGGKVEFEFWRGHDSPGNLRAYRLVVHCGACMWNRREMLSRIAVAKEAGVPITNYGLAIAYTLGIFERALRPFPAAYGVFTDSMRKKG